MRGPILTHDGARLGFTQSYFSSAEKRLEALTWPPPNIGPNDSRARFEYHLCDLHAQQRKISRLQSLYKELPFEHPKCVSSALVGGL